MDKDNHWKRIILSCGVMASYPMLNSKRIPISETSKFIQIAHIIRIGNSQGIRIPKRFLKGLGEKVIIRSSRKGLVIQSEEETAIPSIVEMFKE